MSRAFVRESVCLAQALLGSEKGESVSFQGGAAEIVNIDA
jgi:transcription elongation GreA/GreB family factor